MRSRRIFFVLLGRAIWARKLPSFVMLLTIALGIGVIGGLVNVHEDMDQKMGKEFRTYGANLLVYPKNNADKLTGDDYDLLVKNLPADKLVGAAPMQYSIAYTDNRPFVLVGTLMDQMRKVSPYWEVDGGWAADGADSHEAMVGTEIAALFDLKPSSEWKVTIGTNKEITLQVKGVVTTGSKEDHQIFVPLSLSEKLTANRKLDIVMVSYMENGKALEQQGTRIEEQVPTIAVKPLKQLAQSEEKMAGKIERLISVVSVIIFGTTVLTVSTTMMSMVMERKREIGLKKALGASDFKVAGEFLVEGAALGLAGTGLGMGMAYYVSQFIGKTVFNADIDFRLAIIPWSVLGVLLIIAVSFLIPARRIMEVEPAIVLKGE